METILDQVQIAQTPSLEEVRERLSHQMRDRNRVGLGWLRFSCSVRHLTYWRKRVQEFFRVKLRSRGKGWQGYLESWEGGLGILIGYTPVLTQAQREAMGIKSSPNEGMMTVDIPQSALDTLSDRKHLGLWIDIFGCEDVKFTRNDIYYDDYCKIISPEALHKACKGGGVGVPRYTKLRGWDEYNLQEGKSRGFTVYVGSCKSDRQIRYYDKTLESEGKQDCYRLEMQDTGQYAEKFGPYMLEALQRALDCCDIKDSVAVLRDAYKALLKGAISFHEIPEGVAQEDLPQNWAKRSPQTWWWQEMMTGLEPAKLTLDRVEPSLQKAVAWITNQVSATLSVIRMVYHHWGMPFNSWLATQLEKGDERLSDKHYKMIEEAILTSPAY
jgi:hypothetical protein